MFLLFLFLCLYESCYATISSGFASSFGLNPPINTAEHNGIRKIIDLRLALAGGLAGGLTNFILVSKMYIYFIFHMTYIHSPLIYFNLF